MINNGDGARERSTIMCCTDRAWAGLYTISPFLSIRVKGHALPCPGCRRLVAGQTHSLCLWGRGGGARMVGWPRFPLPLHHSSPVAGPHPACATLCTRNNNPTRPFPATRRRVGRRRRGEPMSIPDPTDASACASASASSSSKHSRAAVRFPRVKEAQGRPLSLSFSLGSV